MSEKQNTTVTDPVEQTKQLIVEYLRNRGSRPVKELEAVIPVELAAAQCEKEDKRTTADLKTPKDRQTFGCVKLCIYAVEALVASGMCEVEGDKGKQEVRLVAQDSAAKA